MRVRKRARHHELLRREAREQRRARGVQHGEGGGEVVLLEHTLVRVDDRERGVDLDLPRARLAAGEVGRLGGWEAGRRSGVQQGTRGRGSRGAGRGGVGVGRGGGGGGVGGWGGVGVG